MSWWRSGCSQAPRDQWKMVAGIPLAVAAEQLLPVLQQRLPLLLAADYWLTVDHSLVVAEKGKDWKTASTHHCGPPYDKPGNT